MSEHSGGGVGDDVFSALADERRRHALAYLRDADGASPVRTLAERVATEAEGVSDAADVTTALHHVHLPKLADAGLVEWDGDAVRTTDRGESLPAELPWLPEWTDEE